MPTPLYIINDLECAYKRGNVVLRIEHLEIQRNQLVVLLGKSGSGKSTLLETLGLMNNTVKKGEVLFFPENGNDPVSLKTLWKNINYSELARIRREYFSFIFQHTNLMPNFTAFENACLTQMIQGLSLQQALIKVEDAMFTMGLGGVPKWKLTSELSGGQKQRLAFVRAITPVFTVLFGDEPTGNLDEFNANELMLKLKQNIHHADRSAIIVSHNIDLSIQYADTVILITKENRESSHGEIRQNRVFSKKSDNHWYTHENQKMVHIGSDIKHILDAE